MRTNWVAFLAVAMAGALVAARRGDADAPGPRLDAAARPHSFADLSTPGFLENGGRLPDAVDFTLDAADRTFFFGTGGATISLHDAERSATGRFVLRLAFEGARDVRPVAEGRRPGFTSFFRGAKESWRVGLETFDRLVYRDAWPGVDLVWRAERGRLKWECDVRAGADPSRVRFSLRGAEGLAIRPDGALAATTPLGDFVDAAPVAWQTVDGRELKVDAAFQLDPRTQTFGVKLGAHDAARDLVIDPSTVLRAGYIGGALDDAATSVAVDSIRDVFVVGVTKSPESSFPVSVGPDPTYNGGPADAFIVKIDPTFHVAWSGYLGGGGDDGAAAVAVDRFGDAYVAGWTASNDFPVFGPLGSTPGGGYDAFVAKITSDGRRVPWSGRFGGAGDDRAAAVAVDAQFRVALAGRTAGGMPWHAGFAGAVDAFVMGIHQDGTFVDWGTDIGGAGADAATGVALDSAGGVYVCGNTASSEITFPVLVGPGQVYRGAQDAWVAKFDANHFPVYAGFIGGAGADGASGIAVDTLGRAYVVGSTTSNETTFPVAVGPHLMHHGKSDAWIARVAADGATLDYCGFVGGSGDEFAYGVALDSSRRAYVVGTTGSTALGYPTGRAKFPVMDGPDATFNGGVHDGFVGVVQPDGSQMASLGYLGGTGNVDAVNAVTLAANGDVFLAGVTLSPAKSFPAGTGPAIVAHAGRESFVAQLSYSAPSPVLLVPHLDSVVANGFDLDASWTDADPNATGFEVQRTDAAGSTTLFAVASSATRTFADTNASPATKYAYRVRAVGPSGVGEFSECASLTTSASLSLKLQKGSIDVAGTAGVAMKYSFQKGAATTSINPVADGISITIVGAGADQTVTIPPNDPAWTVSGNAAVWSTPVSGAVRVVADLVKRTIRLDASGLTFASPQPTNTVRVVVRTGGSYGSRGTAWRGVNATTYRFP